MLKIITLAITRGKFLFWFYKASSSKTKEGEDDPGYFHVDELSGFLCSKAPNNEYL